MEKNKEKTKSTKIVLIILGVIVGLIVMTILCFDLVIKINSGNSFYNIDACDFVVGKITHSYYGTVRTREHSDIDMNADGKLSEKTYSGKFTKKQYKEFKKRLKKSKMSDVDFCNYMIYH